MNMKVLNLGAELRADMSARMDSLELNLMTALNEHSNNMTVTSSLANRQQALGCPEPSVTSRLPLKNNGDGDHRISCVVLSFRRVPVCLINRPGQDLVRFSSLRVSSKVRLKSFEIIRFALEFHFSVSGVSYVRQWCQSLLPPLVRWGSCAVLVDYS